MATGIGSPLALGGLYPSVDGRYVAANGKPFTSVSNAESALNGFPSKLSESCVGYTVLVKESGWTEAKEYWVQPKGTTPETYGLVEKGAGVTDYNDLDNKPTIGDGTNTALPIVGNVKVSAVTASGSTAGVTVTPGQNTGEIEMQFTLPKGDKGEDGTDGQDGQDGAPGHNPCLGRFTTLPTLSPNPFADAQAGDYFYYDTTDQQTSDPVTYIYHFDGEDWDSGTVIDAEHPTFASGQAVTSVHIKNLNGVDDPDAQGVLSAEAGKKLNADVFGGSYEVSEEIEFDTQATRGYYNTKPGSPPSVVAIGDTYNPSRTSTSGVVDNNRCLKLTVHVGEKYVIIHKSSNGDAARRYVITNTNNEVIAVASSSSSIETDTFEPTTSDIIVYVNFYTTIANDFTGQSVTKYSQKIVGGVVNELASNTGYVECETNADTSAKLVEADNFRLTKNARLLVKFINGNTAESPTLNINNTGAKNMYIDGEEVGKLVENEVLDCYYDGTYYQCKSIANKVSLELLEKKILGTKSSSDEAITLDNGYYNTRNSVKDSTDIPDKYSSSQITPNYRCKKISVNANEVYTVVHRSGTSAVTRSYVITDSNNVVKKVGSYNTGLITSVFSDENAPCDVPYNVYINFYTPTDNDFSGMSLTKTTISYSGGALTRLGKRIDDEIKDINYDLHGLLATDTFNALTGSTRIKKNVEVPMGYSKVQMKVELYSGSVGVPSYSIYRMTSTSTDLEQGILLATGIKLGEWYEIPVSTTYPYIVLYSSTVDGGGSSVYKYTFRTVDNIDNHIEVNSLKDKTIVLFGDSISELKWSTSNGGNGKGWVDYFIQQTGANVVNAAVGGSQYKQHAGITMLGGLDVIHLVKAVCSTGNDVYVAQKQASTEDRTLQNVTNVVANTPDSNHNSYSHQLTVSFTVNEDTREVDNLYVNSYEYENGELSYNSDYEIVNTSSEWKTVITAAENTFTGIDRRAKIRNLKNVNWDKVNCAIFWAGSNDWNVHVLAGYPGYSSGDKLGISGVEADNTTLGAFDRIIRLMSETYPHVKIYIIAPMVRYGDAQPFSNEVTYKEGDLCTYTIGSNTSTYKFLDEHTGNWDINDVEVIGSSDLEERAENTWCDNNKIDGRTLKEYRDEIIKEAKKFYLPVLDTYDLGINRINFNNSFLNTDHTHPYKAFKAIGIFIASFIKSHQAF